MAPSCVRGPDGAFFIAAGQAIAGGYGWCATGVLLIGVFLCSYGCSGDTTAKKMAFRGSGRPDLQEAFHSLSQSVKFDTSTLDTQPKLGEFFRDCIVSLVQNPLPRRTHGLLP